MPATNATSERLFSAPRRVKNKSDHDIRKIEQSAYHSHTQGIYR